MRQKLAILGATALALTALAGAPAHSAPAPSDPAPSSHVDPASAPPVVINEAATRGPLGVNDSFVEVRNITEEAVSIAFWQVKACTPAGTEVLLFEFPADAVLAPFGEVGQYFLLAGPEYSGAAAADGEFAFNIADNGGVVLRNADLARADSLGMSPFLPAPTCREGTAATPQPAGQDVLGLALSRNALSEDANINQNLRDFTLQRRSPQNTTSP